MTKIKQKLQSETQAIQTQPINIVLSCESVAMIGHVIYLAFEAIDFRFCTILYCVDLTFSIKGNVILVYS